MDDTFALKEYWANKSTAHSDVEAITWKWIDT